MNPNDVAWIIGVGGGIVGSLFSIISRKIINHLPIEKVLPLCIGWAVIALIALLITASFALSIMWLMLSLFLVASSMEIASTLFLGLMFNFTRQSKRATYYGLQASLFVLARTSLPILAGILLDLGGYILMLSSLLFIMFILFVLSLHQSRYLNR